MSETTNSKLIPKIQELRNKIGTLNKNATNPHFKNTYIDITGIVNQVHPIAHELGLVILQPLSHIDGQPAISTIIMDVDTEMKIETVTPIICSERDPQKMGSAITYFRRYAIQSLLFLGAEDDDGNGARAAEISTSTTKKVRELIDLYGVDKKKICEAYNVLSLESLSESQGKKVIEQLTEKYGR